MSNYILNKIEDFKKTLKPDEIANSLEEFNPKKHKYLTNNTEGLSFTRFKERSDITDLGVLEAIKGSVSFRDTKIKDLKNLKFVSSNLSLHKSIVESLGNLTYVGGEATFYESQVKSLGNLTIVGDDIIFNDSKVENLGNLTTVEGSISTNNNKLTRQQVIDHLNKMNENFFVIKNSLYYPVPNLSVFNIKKKIWNNKDAYIFAPNLRSMPLGKLSIDEDGSIISISKKYS